MKAFTSPADLTRLPLDRRLALYGVAAGATLVAASSAKADIISLDLTGLPTADRTSSYTGITGIASLYFDVNASNAAAAVAHNPFVGADFRIINRSYSGVPPYSGFGRNARVKGTMLSNGVAVEGANQAMAFMVSNFVQPGGNFVNSAFVAGSYKGNPGGLPAGTTAYLGLRFLIGADTHVGWVNLTVNNDLTLTLNALGYETDPNAPAHVEAPGGQASVPDSGNTLFLLAMGAVGLIALRSRQSQPA